MNTPLDMFVAAELKRQNEGLELIASENFTSKKIRELCGSVLTNKYAEGFPGKRYYGGCHIVDQVENLAIEKACELFGCRYANVQPHSGSSANMIAYAAVLKPGDKIMTLALDEGGHLTHGSPVSFSGKYYKVVHYRLGKDGRIDYEAMRKLALEEKPQLILAGFSAYPYTIDFSKFGSVAREIGAIFMVDIAHISGLVATGAHPSPFPDADIVTSTTHKTIRGPRGGLILTNREDIFKKVNSATFPGMQGGPLMHIIAAKAQCFIEALEPSFKQYIDQVLINTKACAQEMIKLGASVSDTDTHLFLVDTKASFDMTGLDAQQKVEEIGITINKNMIPGDKEKPSVTSGVRIGLAATTTRGLTEDGARLLSRLIFNYLSGKIDTETAHQETKKLVAMLKPVDQL
ncbi:MAG TPA: serine hydroxymethyltransferase [Bacilli bacterium]|nr:serine hydroxymethyltransferase [Bacilli bacterium]